jgi:hypothetical protein
VKSKEFNLLDDVSGCVVDAEKEKEGVVKWIRPSFIFQ